MGLVYDKFPPAPLASCHPMLPGLGARTEGRKNLRRIAGGWRDPTRLVRIAPGVNGDAPVDAVVVIPVARSVVKTKLKGTPIAGRQAGGPRTLRPLFHRHVPHVAPLSGAFAAMEKKLGGARLREQP